MKKPLKIFLSVILICVVSAVGFLLGFCYNFMIKNAFKSDKKPALVNGELSIHFLELGNQYVGDSIFIQCGENDILIDAGSRYNSAPTIINYIDQLVTDNTLEYVIATHAHQDHIAAFSSTKSSKGIFDYYEVENIIDFPRTNLNSEVLNNYYAARDKEIEGGANHWSALECYNETNGGQRIIPLSNNVELEILYNYYYDHKTSDENNYSVCVMLNQGDNHYLFTGDLEKEGEGKLVEHYNDLPHCVLYKGGHHGSKTSSSKALLEKITPEYVCICTCAGSDEYSDTNENQFPTQEMIDRIAPYTDKVYVTTYMIDNATHSYASMNGNIVFTVKSGKILLTASNNTLKLKETEWFKENRKMPDAWKQAA